MIAFQGVPGVEGTFSTSCNQKESFWHLMPAFRTFSVINDNFWEVPGVGGTFLTSCNQKESFWHLMPAFRPFSVTNNNFWGVRN